MNDHLWGPSVHVDKSFTKIQARVRPPPHSGNACILGASGPGTPPLWTEIKETMLSTRNSRNDEAQFKHYRCKYKRKGGWLPCERSYKVGSHLYWNSFTLIQERQIYFSKGGLRSHIHGCVCYGQRVWPPPWGTGRLCDWGELSLDGKSRGHCPDGCEEQHKEQFDLEDLARERSNQWQWAAPNCSSGIQHIISIPSIQI